jgi:hypothetical protein
MLKITQLVVGVGVFLVVWVAALQRDLTPDALWVVQAVCPHPSPRLFPAHDLLTSCEVTRAPLVAFLVFGNGTQRTHPSVPPHGLTTDRR